MLGSQAQAREVGECHIHILHTFNSKPKYSPPLPRRQLWDYASSSGTDCWTMCCRHGGPPRMKHLLLH